MRLAVDTPLVFINNIYPGMTFPRAKSLFQGMVLHPLKQPRYSKSDFK